MQKISGIDCEWADVRIVVGGKVLNDTKPQKITVADIRRMQILFALADIRCPKPAKKIRAGMGLYKSLIDSIPTAKLPVDGMPIRLEGVPLEFDTDLGDNELKID